MRHVAVIGIGAGDPEHLTLQGARVLGEADVVLLLVKRRETEELEALRRELIARHARPDVRVVELADPERGRGATAAEQRAHVAAWRAARARLVERALLDELDDGGRAAFLVLGDPGLYDATLGVLDVVRERGAVAFGVQVVPGITAVQALAAAHGVPLHAPGGALHVTTGRRLAAGDLPDDADVAVMLDPEQRFAELAARDDADELELVWGACLGMPGEALVAGPLRDAAPRAAAARAEVAARKGWVFDTWLVRRRRGDRATG